MTQSDPKTRTFPRFNLKIKLVLILLGIEVLSSFVLTLLVMRETGKIQGHFEEMHSSIGQDGQKIMREGVERANRENFNRIKRRDMDQLEFMALSLTKNVEGFFGRRREDILSLAQMGVDPGKWTRFLKSKEEMIWTIPSATFDRQNRIWVIPEGNKTKKARPAVELEDEKLPGTIVRVREGERDEWRRRPVPLYKEMTFFDLKGKERFKLSSLDRKLKDISKSWNTHLQAEKYFEQLSSLQEGEVFVSELVGQYTSTRLLGTYTPELAERMGVPFQPELDAYAGRENPVGRRYEGIIRLITPLIRKGRRMGYVSLAVDHVHLRNVTDFVVPDGNFLAIDMPLPGNGNIAFILDSQGRTLAHPRHAYIVGYEGNSGKLVPSWVDEETYLQFQMSPIKELEKFLATVSPYEDPSWEKKPSWQQLKKGRIPVDCRYLNFAPQCYGWHLILQRGDFGAFHYEQNDDLILTASAVIHWPRGMKGPDHLSSSFGQVVVNRNMNALGGGGSASGSQEGKILQENFEKNSDVMAGHLKRMEEKVLQRNLKIIRNIHLWNFGIILILIFILCWLVYYDNWKIKFLLKGIEEYSKGNLHWQIPHLGEDEIGHLAGQLNSMAANLKKKLRQ